MGETSEGHPLAFGQTWEPVEPYIDSIWVLFGAELGSIWAPFAFLLRIYCVYCVKSTQ
jgi:hypothetical protein